MLYNINQLLSFLPILQDPVIFNARFPVLLLTNTPDR